ncbi:MAG: GIY-YIG nuclease family protein [Dehalococcoidia bacterium]
MDNKMTCARIGCEETASYNRPLCYPHWKEFDRFETFECRKCHRFDEFVGDWDLCWDCMKWKAGGPEVPVHAHAPVEYYRRYLYILKLDGGDYYVGQTNDLELRLAEHLDGKARSTRGKHPKLVYFDTYVGNREELDEDERDLTRLAKKNPRAIRRIVAEWQRPLKLVTLDT